jgi:hypothetical protein
MMIINKPKRTPEYMDGIVQRRNDGETYVSLGKDMGVGPARVAELVLRRVRQQQYEKLAKQRAGERRASEA